MIITIGQQKGGAGKTTLLITFANYLAQECGKTIQVLDWDFQESTSFYYKKDIQEDKTPLYVVETIKEESEEEKIMLDENVLLNLKNDNSKTVLVDTVGMLNSKYVNLINCSNMVLIPFNYNDQVLHSTIRFAKFCKMVNPNSLLVFVPNKIMPFKNNAKLSKKEEQELLERVEINELLTNFGTVIPDIIYYQKNMDGLTTSELHWRQKKNTESAFKKIVDLF